MVEKIPLPDETCPAIDTILREATPLARDALRLFKDGKSVDQEEAAEFIDLADTFFRDLPEVLESLRRANDELRAAAFEYYERLKAAEQENA